MSDDEDQADAPRETEVNVDLEDGEVEVTVAESFTDLFREGELRLWEDSTGWSGYLREDGQFYRVNQRKDTREPIQKVPADPADVVESIEDHVRDPAAGEHGRFVWGCSPP